MEMWETEDDQYVSQSCIIFFGFPRFPSSPFQTGLRPNDDNITQLTSMLHAHEMKLLTQRNMFSEPNYHFIFISRGNPLTS